MRLNCYCRKQIILDKGNSGFTLLEMMLTVFLIGISISMVVPRIGSDADDIAKLEAKRFSALVTHLQDEATIIGLPMGVEMRVTENRYRFWQLGDGWTPVEKQQVLREREVPDTVQLSFVLLQEKTSADVDEEETEDNDEEKPKNLAPANLLIVEPNGLVVPFLAGFAGEKKEFRVALDNQLNTVVSENVR